jgi:hypothetical protein
VFLSSLRCPHICSVGDISRDMCRPRHVSSPGATTGSSVESVARCWSRQTRFSPWLSGKPGGRVGSWMLGQVSSGDWPGAGSDRHPRAVIWWLWSFIRLWVAVMSRHSDSAADLPRRWNRVMRRLNLICPNTGSIVALRRL